MRAAFVIEIILNELEAWNSNGVKTQVIGSTGVPHGYRGNAEVFEGSHPLRKDWGNGCVALQVDSANLARAVVDVEVSRDEFLFGLHFQWTSGAAQEFGKC